MTPSSAISQPAHGAPRRWTLASGLVTVGLVVLAAAGMWWSAGSPTRSLPTGDDVTVDRVVASIDGAALDIVRPAASTPVSVAVLLHGCCGGREDMFQLAHELARRGALVVNVGWTPIPEGGRFPEVYEQTACAVVFARATAAASGAPGEVTLVGWSDGALLGATVAMSDGGLWNRRCADGGSPRPDRFVGVAGFFGWPRAELGAWPAGQGGADAFFGGTPATAPAAWSAGNPYRWIGEHPDAPIDLVVGSDDELLEDAICFDRALRRAGHRSTLTVLADAGHLEVLSPRTPAGSAVVDLVVGTSPPSGRSVGVPDPGCT